ncbi:MAG TPA: FKBP-type peptidyl-prolyl cis-trans isomerase [Phycisphaerae bacterium]|nr:FKBP-type peptidyl-prolyl cis-trans isomerase [Phycisphaerae bacterium]
MVKRLTFVLGAGLLVLPAWLLWAADQPAAQSQVSGPAASQPAGESVFKTDKEKASYAIGMSIASNMKTREVDLDVDLMAMAMKDVMTGKKTAMTEEEMQQVLMDFQRKMQDSFQKQQAELGEKNKVDGAKYLEEHKKQEGVKATPSGLQYKVLKSGGGKESPKPEDRVSVHYKGTLIDGKTFDSSYDRGQPASFTVGGVIKGWTEALQMMKVGDKWEVTIPPDLAYGPTGRQNIPPNSVLVFEVELLDIQSASQPTATQPQM